MSALKRQELHKQGLQMFFSENYTEASQTFEEAYLLYGPHVGLLSDLSASYYLQGEMFKSQEIRKKIELEIESHRDLLSSESLVQTSIFLSKMCEENGEISKAFELLKEALGTLGLSYELRIRILTQVVRLASMFGMQSELSNSYSELLFTNNINAHWDIEIEHALMLAEGKLLGETAAQSRFFKLISNSLNLQDQRLILFDYAEMALTFDWNLSLIRTQLEKFNLEKTDEFEKLVYFFTCKESYYLKLEDLRKSAKKLSFLGFLRILSLNFKRIKGKELHFTRQQVQLLLRSKDIKSKKLLTERWPNLENILKTSDESKVEVYLFSNLKQLTVFDKIYSLERKEGAWILLDSLKSNSQIELNELSKKMGCIAYDEFAYNRIRIAVQRLNKDLTSMTGLSKCLIIRNHVLMVQGVVFR